MRLDRHALDAEPFAAEQIAALKAAIAVDDVVDAEITLPHSISRTYSQEQLVAAFRLARQWWRQGFDPETLATTSGRLQSGRAPDAADLQEFKDIRARFKHLRFAFVLYAADHRCPALFKALTTAMGQLQDGLKQDPPRTAWSGRLLTLLLTRPSLRLINPTVDRLTPSDSADYARFVSAQMASLRTMLAQPAITASQFHAARKIVSRQVAFHDNFRVLFPADEHVVMSRYLAAINGLMGQQHDRLVRESVRGELDYAHASFPVPDDIRRRLERLVALYD